MFFFWLITWFWGFVSMTCDMNQDSFSNAWQEILWISGLRFSMHNLHLHTADKNSILYKLADDTCYISFFTDSKA